ncbi:MAG: hypothetical protein LPK07_03525 [Hymenobacteraceae bacterium]|nr:hypothetical protein [Hymenobacteraceae bacterium]
MREYTMMQHNSQPVKASNGRVYMRNGWIRNGELVQHYVKHEPETQRKSSHKQARQKSSPSRKKGWVDWSKF